MHGIVALAVDNRIGGKVRADLDGEIEVLVGLLATGLSDGPTRTPRR